MPGKRPLHTVVGRDYGVSDLNRRLNLGSVGCSTALAWAVPSNMQMSLPERSRNER